MASLFLAWLFVNSWPNKYEISFDTKIHQKSSFGQVFYKENNDYNEKKSKKIHYSNTEPNFQKHNIELIDTIKLTAIRLDPFPHKGKITINNLTVSSQFFTHSINLKDLEKHTNDLTIEKSSENSITLQSTGNDPSIEIVQYLDHRDAILWKTLYILIFGLLFYMLFELLFMFDKKIKDNTLLSIILVSYTLFAVLGFDWRVASYVLYIFSLLSILYFFRKDYLNKLAYLKHVFTFLFFYIALSYLSIFTSTYLADIDYLNTKIPLIILALIIPMAFYKIVQFNIKYFKVFLTILLILYALFIISLNTDTIILNYYIEILDIQITRNASTQKNYMFWYVLLLFGTLSFYKAKVTKELLFIVFLLALSYYTIFQGYSHSARLAFVVGVLVYMTVSIFHIKKSYMLIMIWVMTFYIIFSPIIFSLIDLSPYHPRLVDRNALYHTAAVLIKEHFIFGYGFGSTLNINIHDFVTQDNLPNHYINSFKGGHPHNLALLFWLEFGIFGAVLLAYFIHKLLAIVINTAHNHSNLPALLGMIVSFDIITSFSWSIWYPQVLLTFSFFGIMLALSLNINYQTKKGQK